MKEERKMSKKEVIGEVLKDQFITNAELLFNELIGKEYIATKDADNDDNETDYYEGMAEEEKSNSEIFHKICRNNKCKYNSSNICSNPNDYEKRTCMEVM